MIGSTTIGYRVGHNCQRTIIWALSNKHLWGDEIIRSFIKRFDQWCYKILNTFVILYSLLYKVEPHVLK